MLPADNSGPAGSLQEAAERESSTEGSLTLPGQPGLPRGRSLSDRQLDAVTGQLACMTDDKSRKDLLGVCI